MILEVAEPASPSLAAPRSFVRIGVASAGLAASWPQFPGLRDVLEKYHQRVVARLRSVGAEVVDAGLLSDEVESAHTADSLRQRDCSLVISFAAQDPGSWVDAWSQTGAGHHWSLSLGRRARDDNTAADLLGLRFVQV